ncbi:MAG: GTP-binding protein, partial [Alphaproteobacteria bacterium]
LVDEALDWTIFTVWLSALVHRHGTKLLRVKCLLNTASDGVVLLDGVQHTLYPPRHLETWPDKDPRSRLVFITRGLDVNAIRNSFEAFNGE